MSAPFSHPKTPMKSIGARDIVKLGYDKGGHLRKEGLLERSFIGNFVQWRQYFVVVRDGCCYVFDNDLSTQHKEAFSLENYCRLECFAKPPKYDYCFKLIPKASSDNLKEQCFATSDDIGRKDWLIAIYKALHVANNIPEPIEVDKEAWNEDIFQNFHGNGSDNKGDRHHIRRKYCKMPTNPSGSSFPKSSNALYDEIQEDPDSDISLETYDDKTTHAQPGWKECYMNERLPLPSPITNDRRLPPLPPTANDKSGTITAQECLTYMNSDLKYEIEDLPVFRGNASDAKRFINGQSVGTFLIRTSRQDVNNVPYVLVVSSPPNEKHYRIYKQENGEINITTGVYFSCLSKLVEHYSKNDLSSSSTGLRLTKHYRCMEHY